MGLPDQVLSSENNPRWYQVWSNPAQLYEGGRPLQSCPHASWPGAGREHSGDSTLLLMISVCCFHRRPFMELLSSTTSGESPRPTLWWWPQRSWRNMSLFSRWGKKDCYSYFWIVSKIGIRQKNSIISKSNVSTLTLDDPMYYLWRAGTIIFFNSCKRRKRTTCPKIDYREEPF